jgi:Holliday junction resolvase
MKGISGERELAHVLTERGFAAKRGQQYQGSPDSPDVICAALSGWHIECKRTERLDLYGALEQASGDAAEHKRPLVIHRKNKQPWVAILLLDDLLNLMGTNIR